MKVMEETQRQYKHTAKKTEEEHTDSFITAQITQRIKSSVGTGPQRSLNNGELETGALLNRKWLVTDVFRAQI